MSFKYRVIGYSPQYAIVDSGTNDFHNINNITSGSQLNILSGGTLNVASGSTVTVPTASSGTTNTTIANTAFVDSYFVKKSGGTITGTLAINGTITAGASYDQSGSSGSFATGTGPVSLNGSVTIASTKTLTLGAAPSLDLHAATKKYVDDGLGLKLSTTGGTTTGFITLNANPTSNLHAATKAYVDGKLGQFDAGDGLYVQTVNSNNQVAVRSQTLAVTPDDLNLAAIHFTNTGWLGAASIDSTYAGYSASTFYNEVKVDQYGRVSVGKQKTAINTTSGDGWYNSVRIQGGYITALSNNTYLVQNDTISVFSDDLQGSTAYLGGQGDHSCTLSISLKDRVSAGTYTKVSVNTKGIVTNVANISSSDITTALGYTPLKDSQAYLTTYKGAFQSPSWGTGPINIAYNSGYNGYTVNGSYLYLPKGIYHLTFWGANNWYTWYYSYWGWSWWSSYWSYYYNPAVIYHNGAIVCSSFANYGGWWWYYNSAFKSDVSQDFVITNVIEVTQNNEYVQFGVPHLAGITFWYNIKVLKLK